VSRWLLLGGALAVMAGCATKGSVRRVETQVMVLRAETARQDSARAAELARIIRLQQHVLDSLGSTRQALRVLDTRVGADITDVLRQLVQTQELVGQSQRRLTEMKASLDARAEQRDAALLAQPADTTTRPAAVTPPAASADQMYNGAMQQYRANRTETARRAFYEFLQQYPEHPYVPDALYFIAESFDPGMPDSAVIKFTELHARFAQSRRAPAALYKVGVIAERRKDTATARSTFQRVIQEYPRSEEAELARERLATLK